METVCAHHWLHSLRGRNPLLSSHAPIHPITCLTHFNIIFFYQHRLYGDTIMVFSRHQVHDSWPFRVCCQVKGNKLKVKIDPIYILMHICGLTVNYASLQVIPKTVCLCNLLIKLISWFFSEINLFLLTSLFFQNPKYNNILFLKYKSSYIFMYKRPIYTV